MIEHKSILKQHYMLNLTKTNQMSGKTRRDKKEFGIEIEITKAHSFFSGGSET